MPVHVVEVLDFVFEGLGPPDGAALDEGADPDQGEPGNVDEPDPAPDPPPPGAG